MRGWLNLPGFSACRVGITHQLLLPESVDSGSIQTAGVVGHSRLKPLPQYNALSACCRVVY